jgi:protein involved in sex pheromone biosynthesis
LSTPCATLLIGTLLITAERRIMKAWLKLKEAAELLGVSTAAVRYRALKKNMYKYRKEVREYGPTVVVSTQSLIDNHPELQDMLSDKGVDEGQMEFVAMTPPDEGPQFVVADAAGRIKVLADELVKVQKREEEIKQEMKELLR